MPYTPPQPSSIDLSGAQTGYTPPSVSNIDLSGGGSPPGSATGNIDAFLGFSAQFAGYMQPVGSIDATLGFDAAFVGGEGVFGGINSEIGFTASFAGRTADTFGAVNANLAFTFSGRGYQDWAANLPAALLQTFYTLTITGSPDLVVPISSWQATLRSGTGSDYLQAVIPAASSLTQAIADRAGGRLVISKGYRFDDGSERSEPIVEAEFSQLRSDRGPRNYTVTVSGFLPASAAQQSERVLREVRTLSFSSSQYRARGAIDLFLRPGMTVTADDVSFEVEFINFYANEFDQFCEVGGR